MTRPVSSLFDCALQAVLKDLPLHEDEFPYLPSSVKTSLAHVMAKRGVLTDKNIKLVSCNQGVCDQDTYSSLIKLYEAVPGSTVGCILSWIKF